MDGLVHPKPLVDPGITPEQLDLLLKAPLGLSEGHSGHAQPLRNRLQNIRDERSVAEPVRLERGDER